MTVETIDLIDIGVNLTHESFAADRSAVLARAAAAGVSRLIVTGATLSGSRSAAALAADDPGRLYATAGVHPHHADEFDDAGISDLRAIAASPGVVAIGECGLDYFRNYSPRESQISAFERQLALAAELRQPVFLHQRDAHQDFLPRVRDYREQLPGGVAHCFTAGPNELKAYLDLGLYVGITGWICDERRAADLREAVRYLPLDRVLLETDAPYLLPRDLSEKPSGRRNEPAYLPHILHKAAGYMGCSPAELAAAATRNTENLFNLAGPERIDQTGGH